MNTQKGDEVNMFPHYYCISQFHYKKLRICISFDCIHHMTPQRAIRFLFLMWPQQKLCWQLIRKERLNIICCSDEFDIPRSQVGSHKCASSHLALECISTASQVTPYLVIGSHFPALYANTHIHHSCLQRPNKLLFLTGGRQWCPCRALSARIEKKKKKSKQYRLGLLLGVFQANQIAQDVWCTCNIAL